MSVYFCSDLHIGHVGIERFRKSVRDTNQNTERILESWRNTVSKRDVVYILGDVCMDYSKLHLFGSLPGRKYLVRGNHDTFKTQDYLVYFDEVFGLLKYKEFWLSHAPIHPNELRGKVNLHGHVHYQTINDKRYLNCCVEYFEAIFGSPIVHLDVIREYLRKRDAI